MNKKAIVHYLGLCFKQRRGYNCHGTRNYLECGSKQGPALSEQEMEQFLKKGMSKPKKEK